MKTNSKPSASQSDVTTQTTLPEAELPATTQPQAIDVLATDEHAGKPGSYVFDPATGQRTKVA
jgi:hypothetical protein